MSKRYLLFLPLVFVLAWSFIYALSYLNIVNSPHPYEAASRWIFANVPPGSRILGVHWDDKLPLHLPGFNPQDFRYQWHGERWELPVYERDDEKKAALMAERLAAADYLIFPTARIPGSIPRLAAEFPYTTGMLQLLYAGKLGYELVQTFKSRPKFGPFVFNDDLADESLSVYDHPKVVIFKNDGRFVAGEIEARILNVRRFAPLPAREEMLLKDAGSKAPPWSSSQGGAGVLLVQVVTWLVVLQVLALIAAPFMAYALPGFKDAGYGLARALGLFFAGYLFWLLQSLGILRADPQAAWFVVVFMALSSFLLFYAQRASFAPRLKLWRHEWSKVELLFLCAFLIFLVLRAFQPEIFWGEKPMNFTFLNYFIRLENLPPADPWASGQPMDYYYLGTFLYAFVHKLSGVDARIGYNLSIASIAAALVCAVYSTLLYLTARRWAAVVGAGAVAALSNLEWLRLVLFEPGKRSFDLFWATTRLFTSPAFAEYPLWTYLFGDLHAHVIALPLVAAALGLMAHLNWWRVPCLSQKEQPWSLRQGQNFALLVLLALVWGALIAVNTWDFISLGLVLAVLGLLSVLRLWCQPHSQGRRATALGQYLSSGMVLTGLAVAAVWPYLASSSAASKANWGWVYAGEFNTLGQVFRHLGVWLTLIAAGLAGFLLKGRGNLAGSAWRIALCSLSLMALPAGLAFLSWFLGGARGQPWLIVVLACLMVLVGAFLFLSAADAEPGAALAGGFLASSGMLIAVCELVFIMDRMNTIFKLYNLVWLLMGLCALALAAGHFKTLTSFRQSALWRRVIKTAALATAALVCLLSLCGSLLNVGIMTSFRRVEGPRPALNGSAYLERLAPDEAKLFEWINRNIKGTPVVLEAQGMSYGPYTRVAMHSGLPTVLGWEYHVYQRGTPRAEIEARRRDVRSIYQSSDAGQAYFLLLKYGVQYVVASDLEKRTYPSPGLAKFEDNPALFERVFSAGDTRLYKVNYGGR